MSPFTETGWHLLFGIYLLASGIQLSVCWGIFKPLAQYKKTDHAVPDPNLEVSASVILCARNEVLNLRRYLPEILTQHFENQWEVLVVDDASADETFEVLQHFQQEHPERLRILRLTEKITAGKKTALAAGIAAARFEHILLTDADCRPAGPFWLKHMIAALSVSDETEIVLGYGPNFDAKQEFEGQMPSHQPRSEPWHKSFFRYETAFTAIQYFSLALAGMPYMGVGRNLAFKRRVYNRAGGFSSHAHIASGDDDLLVNAVANRTNTAICLEPGSFMYSEAPSDFTSWCKQKHRHLQAGPAYRWKHKMILSGLALAQTVHYMLFPVLLLGGYSPVWVLLVFLLRQISLQLILGKILRKTLREPGLVPGLLLYDFGLALYYGILVPWFLIRQKAVTWTWR